MRAIVRRLQRLEGRLAPAMESRETRGLRARLEAARQRCGLPPIPPERIAELIGRSIGEILHSGRPSYMASHCDSPALLTAPAIF